MTSFSDQLNELLASQESTVVSDEANKEFLAEVEMIKQWLSSVFYDPGFQLIGFVGDTRYLQGIGRRPLDIYARVNNLFFCARFKRHKEVHVLYVDFQIGYVKKVNNHNGRKSCFHRLSSTCGENNFYRERLNLHFNGIDLKWPTLPSSEEKLADIRAALAETAFNTLKHKPDLRNADTVQLIEAELFAKRDFKKFVTEPVLIKQCTSDEEYFASVPKALLNTKIIDLLSLDDWSPEHKDSLFRDIDRYNIITVRDALKLNEFKLRHVLFNWQVADQVFDWLESHDLELAPRSYELPPHAPVTVTDLFNTSQLKDTERPRNCLNRVRIRTTKRLVMMTEDELLSITNFGEKSLATTKEALKQHGLHLRPSGPAEE